MSIRYYNNSPETDLQGPDSGSNRVKRGGNYNNNANNLRCSNRNNNNPNNTNNNIGFRISNTTMPEFYRSRSIRESQLVQICSSLKRRR
ncbi:MAG: SUMF1/EgtB/PvdO family nonheme iron enzyme [Fidelibacterota bacterium]